MDSRPRGNDGLSAGAAPASAFFGGSIIGIRVGARVASNCTGSALVKS